MDRSGAILFRDICFRAPASTRGALQSKCGCRGAFCELLHPVGGPLSPSDVFGRGQRGFVAFLQKQCLTGFARGGAALDGRSWPLLSMSKARRAALAGCVLCHWRGMPCLRGALGELRPRFARGDWSKHADLRWSPFGARCGLLLAGFFAGSGVSGAVHGLSRLDLWARGRDTRHPAGATDRWYPGRLRGWQGTAGQTETGWVGRLRSQISVLANKRVCLCGRRILWGSTTGHRGRSRWRPRILTEGLLRSEGEKAAPCVARRSGRAPAGWAPSAPGLQERAGFHWR